MNDDMNENTREEIPTTEGAASTSAATTKQNSWMVPIAIVIGFGLIALAIFFSNGGSGGGAAALLGGNNGNTVTDTGTKENLTPISLPTEDDYIRGNPNAEVMIVEYSDFDCPFCKRFHDTMNNIMASPQAQDGKIAWTYRHFPIQNLHPNAPALSHGAECTAHLAGEDAFWEYADTYYTEQGQVTDIAEFAARFGVDTEAMTACMTEERYLTDVQDDLNEAVQAGGRGTPYNVFVFSEPITSELKGIINQLNMQTGNGFVIISDTQVGMKGAFPESVINQVIAAHLGL